MNRKNPNEYKRVIFRAAALEDDLAVRADLSTERAFSQVAKRDLERYYYLLRESLPTFSEAEARILVDTLNGSRSGPEIAHLLWAEVDDRLQELIKTEVDQTGFIARLRALSRFECMAVIDAVERYWIGPSYKSAKESAERLRAVGLVK